LAEVHKVLTSPYHPSLSATELLQSQLNGGEEEEEEEEEKKKEKEEEKNFQGHASSDYHKLDLKEG
jgi:hypothetical protein